jgi:hypothetical protein
MMDDQSFGDAAWIAAAEASFKAVSARARISGGENPAKKALMPGTTFGRKLRLRIPCPTKTAAATGSEGASPPTET